MKKTQFISKLNPKDEVNSPFLLKSLSMAEGKDGKSYLNIVLGDNSGEIEAKKWHGADLTLQKIKCGDIVMVQGKVNQFQNRLQLIIQEIGALLENQYEKSDYIQKAGEAPEKMYEELLNLVQNLDEVYIKELLLNILQNLEISSRLKIWQAGKSIHHAYQSGLLEHILSCAKLGVTLSPHYKVNTSYVVAGCILHDICKIYELTEGPNVEYTNEGKLIGHLVMAIELIEQFSNQIKNFPIQIKLHLKHILLSHHGEYEYGSPKIPETSEAYLVHLIDLMDSKMSSFDQVKKTDSNTTSWSNFVKHLDRIVYKDELPSFKSPIFENETLKAAPSIPVNKISNSNTKMASLLKDFKPN